jgi:tRNA G46 methylase TrmB
VFEIGIGTGRNLPSYSPGLNLVGIELSEEMLAIAKQRTEHSPVKSDLRLSDAQAIGSSRREL